MPAYTTETPGQDGTELLDEWSDTGPTLGLSEGAFQVSRSGLVFDTAGLGILSGEVRIALAVGSATPAVATIQLWLVPEIAPANYANVFERRPMHRNEVLIAETIYQGQAPGHVVELVLGQTHNAANQAQIDAALEQLRAITSLASWSSRVAFSLKTDTGAFLLFEAAEGAGTPPTFEVVELAQQEMTVSHIAKEARKSLIKRLNTDSALTALGIKFEDMLGRTMADLDKGKKRGFVGTHPETAMPDQETHDRRYPGQRSIEIAVLVVVGESDPGKACDLLDDAQEAIELSIKADPTLGGWFHHMVFASAEQVIDGRGRRDYGTRALVFHAAYWRAN